MISGTKIDNNFHPLVSIIIPVYNGSNYLQEAIDSAINQAYDNCEIIVVNDGSNDDGKTENIANSYAKKGQIRYFSKPNGGVGSALNYAIDKMEGGYFSCLSHDDLYKPSKISHQIKLLGQLENKQTIIYGGYNLIDKHRRLIHEVRPHKHIPLRKQKAALYPLLKGYIHGCALLIPKKCFDEVGGFDESLSCTQDYSFWFKLLRKYPLLDDKKVFTEGRDHDERGTYKSDKFLKEGNDLWIRFLQDLSKAEKAEVFDSEASFYVNMHERLKLTEHSGALAVAEKLQKSAIENIKVSVIVLHESNDNGLENSIDSLKKQTHKNLEIIILDAGGQLKGANWRKSAEIVSAQSSGRQAAINKAMQRASGEYIAFLDSGDEFVTTKLEQQLHFMLLNHESMLSYLGYSTMNDDLTKKKPTKKRALSDEEQKKYTEFPDIILNNKIKSSTVMFKANVAKTFQLPEEFLDGSVTCFVIQVASRFQVVFLDKPLTIIKNTSYELARKRQINKTLNILCFIGQHPYLRQCYQELHGLGLQLTELLAKAGFASNKKNHSIIKRGLSLVSYFMSSLQKYGLKRTIYTLYSWLKRRIL